MILTAFLCAGCSNFYWPAHGRGGMAEDRPPTIPPHICACDIELIRDEIKSVKTQIYQLANKGADNMHPALFHKITLQLALVEREFDGYFYKESQRNLETLKTFIQKMQEKMPKRQT